MYTFLVVIQVLVAVGLIALVLLQHGKGADAGAAFGSGASGTVFGARGSANFLTRATAWLATIFFGVSLALAYLVNGKSTGGSVTDSLPAAPAAATAPALPAPAATTAPAPAAATAAPAAATPAAAQAAKPAEAPAAAGEQKPKLPE